jgi:hypothetical protein
MSQQSQGPDSRSSDSVGVVFPAWVPTDRPVPAVSADLPRRLALSLTKHQAERLGDADAVSTWLRSEPGVAVVSVLKWLCDNGALGPDPVIDGTVRTFEHNSVHVVVSYKGDEWRYVWVRPHLETSGGSWAVHVHRFTLSDEHGTTNGPEDTPLHTEIAYQGDHLTVVSQR